MATTTNYLAAVSSILSSGRLILEDPALPAVIERVVILHDLEKQRVAKSGAPSQAPAGIGLREAVKPLDVAIWYRKNPWVAYAAIGLILGIPFLLGRASR